MRTPKFLCFSRALSLYSVLLYGLGYSVLHCLAEQEARARGQAEERFSLSLSRGNMGSMPFSLRWGKICQWSHSPPVRGAFCFSPVVSPIIVRGWWVVTGLLTGTLLSPIPFRDACDWCPSHEEDDSSMSSITLSCYCS